MTKKKLDSEKSIFWTDERMERLKALCESQRHSLQEMADILGTSKGSVAGKMNRLQLSNGRPMVRIKTKTHAQVKISGVDVDKWFRERVPVVTEPKPWMERAFGQCAFPLDVDGSTHSCCKPVETKTVKGILVLQNYCEDHCAIMYDNWKPARPRPPQLKTEGRFA